MNYAQSPFGPVAIVPASALRTDRTLLRRLENSPWWRQRALSTDDIPVNLAYYSNSSPRPRSMSVYSPYWESPPLYRTRSYTTNSIFNEPSRDVPSYVKAVSGPVKYPEPLYRKRVYSRSKSADWISQGRPGLAVATDSPVRMMPRPAPYPASYVTYPPSSFYTATAKGSPLIENIGVRLALKIAQLVVGAIVIGTVSGPAQGEAFSSFAARTRSGGQIYVLVIACLCLIITAALLLTVYFAKRSQVWRNVDGIFNASAAFLYLVAGCVEAWYANCYPPYGNAHPEVCRLVAWAIAAIFAFANLVLYTIDFVLAAQAGIDFNL